MEITISVPRTFDIDLVKFREYLISTGWKHTTMYWDGLERFKKLNFEIAIPYPDSDSNRKQHCTLQALKTLSFCEGKDVE